MKRFLIIAALMALGCEDPPSAPPAEVSTPPAEEAPMEAVESGGGFFDEAALLDESVELGGDFTVVPCVGATPEEQKNLAHPRLIRGQVLAPFGRLASVVSPFPGWLVGTAHAVPVEGESTVPDVDVRLVLKGADGAEKPLAEAKSDALGRFCMKLPKGVEFGPRVMLIVSAPRIQMRAAVLSKSHGNVGVLSEAVVRLAQQHGLLQDSARARLINLSTYADTAVDIIAPLALEDGEGVEAAVAKVVAHLQADQRFSEALSQKP